MASYQMPQFLDSGDKILGPLSLRQFGYALGGFMLALTISSVTSTIIKGAGVLVWLPAAPVVALSAYLALGKFNGRDTDIYAYKLFLYLIKPRRMTYQRLPYLDDLNQKLNELTVEKIDKRWQSTLSGKQNASHDDVLAFREGNSTARAQQISRLAHSLNANNVNTMSAVEREELIIKQNEAYLKALKSGKNKQDIVLNPDLIPQYNNTSINNHNFFDETPS